jgi:transposase-like protein
MAPCATRITDRVIDEMAAWWARPLEPVYAAVFIDVIYVKVRDGQVRNRPIYAAIGVELAGHKDILGIWSTSPDGIADRRQGRKSLEVADNQSMA